MVTPFAWHSGDFTSALPPDGASEFIDVDLDRALELGFRYISMDVRVYRGPTFLYHEQCFAGFMLRKEATLGEIFEPASVWSKFDITHDGKSTVPCLFDIKTRQMIWIDCPIQFRRLDNVANNLSNNLATVLDVLKSYLEMQSTKVTISEPAEMHARAVKTEIVTKRDDADFVVGLENDRNLDVYDFATINAQWI